MLSVRRVDKTARSVPVLRDGGVVAVLRAADPPTERVAADVGERSWVLVRRGASVTGRPSEAPEERVVLRAQTSVAEVLSLALDGRPIQVQRRSWLRGMHVYREAGRVVARSGVKGYFRPTTTLDADESLTLDHQVLLLCLDLYTCRRNTTAGRTLGITPYIERGV